MCCKATVVELNYYVSIGAIGNAQAEGDSRNDPTAFGWFGGGGNVWIAGKCNPGHGGWSGANLRSSSPDPHLILT